MSKLGEVWGFDPVYVQGREGIYYRIAFDSGVILFAPDAVFASMAFAVDDATIH